MANLPWKGLLLPSWVSAVSLVYPVPLKLLHGELRHRVKLAENESYENAPFPVGLGREE